MKKIDEIVWCDFYGRLDAWLCIGCIGLRIPQGWGWRWCMQVPRIDSRENWMAFKLNCKQLIQVRWAWTLWKGEPSEYPLFDLIPPLSFTGGHPVIVFLAWIQQTTNPKMSCIIAIMHNYSLNSAKLLMKPLGFFLFFLVSLGRGNSCLFFKSIYHTCSI